MPLTLFFAQLLGVFCIVVSLPMLFRKKEFVRVVNDMLGSPALLYFAGVVALLMGLAVVLVHNIWNQGAVAFIVTLIGWLAVLKGVFILLMPDDGFSRWVRMIKMEAFAIPYGIVLLILGIYLAHAGFTS